jgi:hypothetical protein
MPDIFGFLFLVLMALWAQSYTILGGGIAWLCYRKNSKGFGAFLAAGVIPGIICLYNIWYLFFGDRVKDAQDGLVVLFLPSFLWVLFIGILVVGLIGGYILQPVDREKTELDIRPYLLAIPVILVVLTSALLFYVAYKNPIDQILGINETRCYSRTQY